MPGILSGRLFHVHNPPSDERSYRSTIARNVNEGFELWAEFHNARQGCPGFVWQICTVQTQLALSEDELNMTTLRSVEWIQKTDREQPGEQTGKHRTSKEVPHEGI